MKDYVINPALMGGLVKKIEGDTVKVHLHGRLGVIAVPRSLVEPSSPLAPGHEMQFYFSYLEINPTPYDYDLTELKTSHALSPTLVGGVLTEVNDTAVKAALPDGLGTVAVPRRWVFTDQPLTEGMTAEFYFSPMKVIGKRDIPAESI